MPRKGLLHLVTSEGHEQASALAVDRYWDAVVSGQSLPDGLIDRTLAATIHRVDELAGAPLPDPVFAAQLERELLGSARLGHAQWTNPGLRPSTTRPEPKSLQLDGPMRARRLALNVAAAAALLALVVVSSLVSLWAGSLEVRERSAAPLVLAPGITDEKLLLQARFDAVPNGVLSPALSRWVLQPGAEVVVGSMAPGETAPAAYIVETGALSLHADVPLMITRAGETTPIPLAEASWTTLLPSDRLFVPSGVAAQWRNDGSHPVRILEATFASRDVRPQPPGVLRFPVISDPSNASLNAPLVMRVIEVTLHPEGALPADLIPGLIMIKVESGRLVAVDVDSHGNQLPPVQLGQATRFLGSFPPGRVFRSGNSEPVQLLLVTLADANLLGTQP